MIVQGTRLNWDRHSNSHIQTEFTVEVPDSSVVSFDASQSTMIIKDPHGKCLVALKNTAEVWQYGIEVQWEVKGDTATLLAGLKKQVKELEAENRFLKEQTDV